MIVTVWFACFESVEFLIRVIHSISSVCWDTGCCNGGSVTLQVYSALHACMHVCVAQVFLTAAQPWDGGAAFLLGSWTGQPKTRVDSQAMWLAVVHIHRSRRVGHFFAFFIARRPFPNSIHDHSAGFDRWSDINVIFHAFLLLYVHALFGLFWSKLKQHVLHFFIFCLCFMFLLQFNSDQSLQHDCSDDPHVLSLIDIQCCGEVFAPLPE